MDKWEYMEIELVSASSGQYTVQAVIINGKRHAPPENARTMSQVISHFEKQGWQMIKSYSNHFTFKRALAA